MKSKQYILNLMKYPEIIEKLKERLQKREGCKTGPKFIN
jgi:hypothetical protein